MAGALIVCVTAPRNGPPVTGLFLESYDPEAHGGRGFAVWTDDVARAKVFPSALAAMKLWQAIPVSRPVRGDGKPNKPLTAFTIAVEPAL